MLFCIAWVSRACPAPCTVTVGTLHTSDFSRCMHATDPAPQYKSYFTHNSAVMCEVRLVLWSRVSGMHAYAEVHCRAVPPGPDTSQVSLLGWKYKVKHLQSV